MNADAVNALAGAALGLIGGGIVSYRVGVSLLKRTRLASKADPLRDILTSLLATIDTGNDIAACTQFRDNRMRVCALVADIAHLHAGSRGDAIKHQWQAYETEAQNLFHGEARKTAAQMVPLLHAINRLLDLLT